MGVPKPLADTVLTLRGAVRDANALTAPRVVFELRTAMASIKDKIVEVSPITDAMVAVLEAALPLDRRLSSTEALTDPAALEDEKGRVLSAIDKLEIQLAKARPNAETEALGLVW